MPANEVQRLGAVRSYEILDTAPEPEFDALARLAAQLAATPIALVAMMDSDRLWFKSRLGLDLPQLDRRIAFCAHAIAEADEPLVVEDLSLDRRFVANPLVALPPHLRFYAGAPLVDAAGHALGTIAVVDTEPRGFSDAQRDALIDLAALAVTVLQARRRALELQRLAMTDDLTGIGNRTRFNQAIAAELGQASRSGQTFNLLCMDLDGFKSINDRYGHAAGDDVLCEVARRLTQQVRQGDTLARIGGDEFAVLQRGGDPAAAALLAERIRLAVQQPIVLSKGATVQVGISVGTTCYSLAGNSASWLLAEADAALYKAKKLALAARREPAADSGGPWMGTGLN
jgi:diguanylate cyclase (GGDEF)-like protein